MIAVSTGHWVYNKYEYYYHISTQIDGQVIIQHSVESLRDSFSGHKQKHPGCNVPDLGQTISSADLWFFAGH
jgi:hypothetical protein